MAKQSSSPKPNPKREVAAGAPKKPSNKPGPFDDIARGAKNVGKTVSKGMNKLQDVQMTLSGAKSLEKAIKNPSPRSVVKAVIDVGSAAAAGSARAIGSVAGETVGRAYGKKIGEATFAQNMINVTSKTKGVAGLTAIAANKGAAAKNVAAKTIKPSVAAATRAMVVGGAAITKQYSPKNKSKTNKR